MGKRDLITKDFALYVVHYFSSMLTWSKKDILMEIDRAIKEAQPEDAVRVVRCKDCKHYVLQACACRHENFNGIIHSNGYCYYGEKRTNPEIPENITHQSQ